MIARMDRLAREKRDRLAAGTLLFFIAFESVWANFRWGFHDTALSFFAQSWAFALWFGGAKSPRGRALAIILLGVSAFSKEILLLDVGLFFGLWALGFAFDRKRRPAIACGLTTVALFVTFVAFQSIKGPTRKNYFERYYAYLGENLGDFLATALTRPWVIGQTVGWLELAAYALTLIGPFLAMPFFAQWSYPSSKGAPEIQKLPPRLWKLAVLPSIASAALSTWDPHRKAEFHHVFDIWPVLILLTLLYLAKAKAKGWLFAWVMLAALTLRQDPMGQLREYTRQAREAQPLRAAMRAIPADGWVMASDNAGPWLANRPETTRFPERDLWPERCPQYILLEADPERARAEIERELPDCAPHFRGEPLWNVRGWILFKA
jgi:hypothetical protein